jgi:5-methylcytosine-specific restriction endonuclease McrA
VCSTCQKTTRSCIECGNSFKGTNRLCESCRYFQMSPEDQKRHNKERATARRARKYDALVEGWVPASTYAAILAEGLCVYCDAPAAHVDHVRPLSRGGYEHESNLVPACADCNLTKGAKLLDEWDNAKVLHAVERSWKVREDYAQCLDDREYARSQQ